MTDLLSRLPDAAINRALDHPAVGAVGQRPLTGCSAPAARTIRQPLLPRHQFPPVVPLQGHEAKSYKMTPNLKATLQRALELRKKNRGGAVSLPADYLFITKHGNPYGKEAFKSLWRAVRTKLSLKTREITFHDMRAKAASDTVSDVAAQELLHHADVKVTRKVYRRKVPSSPPLPSARGGRNVA